jgi:hypothetical protein
MTTKPARPGWFDRVLAASCYLGFAPWLLLGRRRERPFVNHHFTYGVSALLLFLLLLLLSIATLGVSVYLGRTPGDTGESVGYVLAALSVLWLIAGFLCAGFGTARCVPPLGWMGRRPWCVRTALAGNLLVWAAVLLIAALTWHANAIAREDLGSAQVYVLVDKLGAEKAIPHAAVKLACYRLALAARECWGDGSIVVTHLNEQSFRAALRHGRLVVIWSHGAKGAISMPDGWATADVPRPAAAPVGMRLVYFWPTEGPSVRVPAPVEIGDGLQYLYCSACEGSTQAKLWEDSIRPANVKMHDGSPNALEHIVWLWFEAPELARELKQRGEADRPRE